MAEKQMEALEKLNQGIRESNYLAQQQTIKLAQDYFDDSTETLKKQIKESRDTLEGLPDQILGGREEAFQAMFQELMENYETIEGCLDEARENVSNLDPEQIRREGEVNATDAARRDARELGIDITEVEGTGSDGRVTVDDVKNFAEATRDGADGEEPKASEAAKRRAEEMGIDLSRVAGTGSGGLITVKDVKNLVEGAGEKAAGAEEEVDDLAGQASEKGEVEEPDATNAARSKAEELGIDLSEVKGTGSGGLITIKDVLEKA